MEGVKATMGFHIWVNGEINDFFKKNVRGTY